METRLIARKFISPLTKAIAPHAGLVKKKVKIKSKTGGTTEGYRYVKSGAEAPEGKTKVPDEPGKGRPAAKQEQPGVTQRAKLVINPVKKKEVEPPKEPKKVYSKHDKMTDAHYDAIQDKSEVEQMHYVGRMPKIEEKEYWTIKLRRNSQESPEKTAQAPVAKPKSDIPTMERMDVNDAFRKLMDSESGQTKEGKERLQGHYDRLRVEKDMLNLSEKGGFDDLMRTHNMHNEKSLKQTALDKNQAGYKKGSGVYTRGKLAADTMTWYAESIGLRGVFTIGNIFKFNKGIEKDAVQTMLDREGQVSGTELGQYKLEEIDGRVVLDYGKKMLPGQKTLIQDAVLSDTAIGIRYRASAASDKGISGITGRASVLFNPLGESDVEEVLKGAVDGSVDVKKSQPHKYIKKEKNPDGTWRYYYNLPKDRTISSDAPLQLNIASAEGKNAAKAIRADLKQKRTAEFEAPAFTKPSVNNENVGALVKAVENGEKDLEYVTVTTAKVGANHRYTQCVASVDGVVVSGRFRGMYVADLYKNNDEPQEGYALGAGAGPAYEKKVIDEVGNTFYMPQPDILGQAIVTAENWNQKELYVWLPSNVANRADLTKAGMKKITDPTSAQLGQAGVGKATKGAGVGPIGNLYKCSVHAFAQVQTALGSTTISATAEEILRKHRDALDMKRPEADYQGKGDEFRDMRAMGISEEFIKKNGFEILHKYQGDAIAFILDRKSGICALDMGLGKTITSLCAMQYLRTKGILEAEGRSDTVFYVAPVSTLGQLETSIADATGEDVGTVHDLLDKGWATKAQWEAKKGRGHKYLRKEMGPDGKMRYYYEPRKFKYYALGISAFSVSEKGEAVGKVTDHKFEVKMDKDKLAMMKERIAELNVGGVVIDETHSLKNAGSLRSRNVSALLGDVPYKMGLSGTPYENGPTELYGTYSFYAPGELPPKKAFEDRYLEKMHGRVMGINKAHVEELRTMIGNRVFYRYSRDYLDDMPKTDIITSPDKNYFSVTMTSKQKQYYDKVGSQYKVVKGKAEEVAARSELEEQWKSDNPGKSTKYMKFSKADVTNYIKASGGIDPEAPSMVKALKSVYTKEPVAKRKERTQRQINSILQLKSTGSQWRKIPGKTADEMDTIMESYSKQLTDGLRENVEAWKGDQKNLLYKSGADRWVKEFTESYMKEHGIKKSGKDDMMAQTFYKDIEKQFRQIKDGATAAELYQDLKLIENSPHYYDRENLTPEDSSKLQAVLKKIDEHAVEVAEMEKAGLLLDVDKIPDNTKNDPMYNPARMGKTILWSHWKGGVDALSRDTAKKYGQENVFVISGDRKTIGDGNNMAGWGKVKVQKEYGIMLERLEGSAARATGAEKVELLDSVAFWKGNKPNSAEEYVVNAYWEKKRASGGMVTLVASDAANAGLNIQCANLSINHDLPYNPMMKRQRDARSVRQKNYHSITKIVDMVVEYEGIDTFDLATKRRLDVKEGLFTDVLQKMSKEAVDATNREKDAPKTYEDRAKEMVRVPKRIREISKQQAEQLKGEQE